MPSDRSRFSYDEAQQYRSVGIQQGRAVTDSDFNELQDILSEETRKEALDIVGPSGTPDDGYKISIPGGLGLGDFAIGAGTMYVGGVRVTLPALPSVTTLASVLDPSVSTSLSPAALRIGFGGSATSLPPYLYSRQPDWLVPTPSGNTGGQELIWLELLEQEISAVEDPALLEPALGGPDTATRMRIIQRIRRSPVAATTCSDALTAQRAAWSSEGREWDPATRRLLPQSELKVSFLSSNATAAGPCDPVSQDGYLGAENQLIRVRLTTTRNLVWSYDNASFVYRVDSVATGGTGLVLATDPVDEAHRPGGLRSVELLRGGIRLADGSIAAEPVGKIVASVDFHSDERTLLLASALPAGYAITPDRPLFVRIWERELPFAPGSPVTLTGTGLQVTIRTRGTGVLAEGDFWTFAVRPSTPAAVYPQRYLRAFQPPEGPRRWATSLAVLTWTSATQGTVSSDCREPFDNLVELSSRKAPKSCCLTIDPSDLVAGSFQPILDAARDSGAFKICMLPGVYSLHTPIVLSAAHSGLVFESCRGGVVIAGGSEPAFADGIVQMDRATGVTFRDLQFRIPLLPARGSVPLFNVFLGDGTTLNFDPGTVVQPQVDPGLTEAQTLVNIKDIKEIARSAGDVVLPPGGGFSLVSFGSGIGIRSVDPGSLTVEDCQFLFPTGADIGLLGLTAALGVGILIYGNASSFTAIRRNRFIGRQLPAQDAGRATIVGVAAIPALLAPSTANPFGFVTPALVPPPTGGGATTAGGTTAAATNDNVTARQADTARADLGVTEARTSLILDGGNVDILAPGRPDEGSVLPPVVHSVLPGRMLSAVLSAVEVSGNHFAGCSAAMFLCADTGSLRLSGNDVSDSIDGFLVIPPYWLGTMAFLGGGAVVKIFADLGTALAKADAQSRWNAVQGAAESVAALTHPGHVWLATTLMSLALPPTIAGRTDLELLEAALDRKNLLAPLLQRTDSVFTASNSQLNPPHTFGLPKVETLIGNRLGALWGPAAPQQYAFFALPNQNLANIGFGSLLGRPPRLSLSLQCAQNAVDTRSGGSSGTALLVLGNGVVSDEAAVVSGYHFSNASKALTTQASILINRTTVTGNLIQNEQPFEWELANDKDPLREFWSLVLVPGVRPPDNIPQFIPVLVNDPRNTATQTDAANAVARVAGTAGTVIFDGIGGVERFIAVDPAWIPSLVAVTGNVFKGYPVLPPRVMPAPSVGTVGVTDPFNTWLFLNTVSW